MRSMTPNLRLWGREVAPVPGLAAESADDDAAAEIDDSDREDESPPAVRSRLNEECTEGEACCNGPVGGGGSA